MPINLVIIFFFASLRLTCQTSYSNLSYSELSSKISAFSEEILSLEISIREENSSIADLRVKSIESVKLIDSLSVDVETALLNFISIKTKIAINDLFLEHVRKISSSFDSEGKEGEIVTKQTKIAELSKKSAEDKQRLFDYQKVDRQLVHEYQIQIKQVTDYIVRERNAKEEEREAAKIETNNQRWKLKQIGEKQEEMVNKQYLLSQEMANNANEKSGLTEDKDKLVDWLSDRMLAVVGGTDYSAFAITFVFMRKIESSLVKVFDKL